MNRLPGQVFHRGAAFGDFNRDGRVDVVVTRLNESPLVLWNVTPRQDHWLVVRLECVHSNRDGIGARFYVVTDAVQFWSQATTSVGYAGSDSRIVHFGLGPPSEARKIEIEWPFGARQTLENVLAARYLTVTEPANRPDLSALVPTPLLSCRAQPCKYVASRADHSHTVPSAVHRRFQRSAHRRER